MFHHTLLVATQLFEASMVILDCNRLFDYLVYAPNITDCDMYLIVFVTAFSLPGCFGQETANGSFGLQVKLPLAYLSS